MPTEMTEWMFFNPAHKSSNNYSAWENSLPNEFNKIVLGRITINKNGYEYYLLKPQSKLMHKIDPFLKEQGVHIRIMYALRKMANNSVITKIRKYSDHIHLKLSTHLPKSEQALLESYAWPDNHIKDRLCWTMYDYIWEYIKPHFEVLGLKIVEEKYG